MEGKPIQINEQEQVPLFIDHKNEVMTLIKELSSNNIISGGNYLRLIKYGSERGFSNDEVDKMISSLGIEIKSKFEPREPTENARYH